MPGERIVTQAGWRTEIPPDGAWRPNSATSRAERSAEQDEAAGGRECRVVSLPSGKSAVASIYLRLPPKARRIYAYLRWSAQGRTTERYVCEVTAETRPENLAQAWRVAIERKVLADASASWASSEAVRNVMRANKSRDTGPELALRRAVHALGLRYRVNRRPVPSIRRSADLVFPGPKVAVFLDGCYWHGCSEHYRPSTKNAEFWSEKIERNQTRDAETDRLLHAAGWTVIRIWEHEDPVAAADRVAEVVLRGSTHNQPFDVRESIERTPTPVKT